MPTPRIFRLAGVLLLSHALAPPNLLAQYGGGPGDGHDRTTVMQLSLDGAPRGTNPLYAGGGGDGFDVRAASAALGGQSLAVLYGGGRGDGFDALRVSLALSGQQLSVLYGGGAGDGFDALSTSRTLSGASLAMLYGGGSGDGFDVERESLSLDGATLAVLYGGGPGDGFDARRESLALGGASLAVLFGGGAGDGFDVGAFAGTVPLPLTLLTFGAEFTSDDLVLVTWTTTDERGTAFFVVERAADAVAFAELGEVEAIGQDLATGAQTDYRFIDEAPLAGTGYYRLQMHDADGAVEFSEVVALSRQVLAKAAPWQYTLYPNPNAGNELYVAPKDLPADPALEIEVRDALGRLVYRSTEDYPGSGKVRISLERRLSAGTYLVRVRSGEVQQSKILVVSGGGA